MEVVQVWRSGPFDRPFFEGPDQRRLLLLELFSQLFVYASQVYPERRLCSLVESEAFGNLHHHGFEFSVFLNGLEVAVDDDVRG